MKAFLADVENVENQFEDQRELTGLIHITCVTAFSFRHLTPVIVKFNKLYPKVSFEIDSSDRYVDLIDSQMDIAIRADDPHVADFVYKKLVENKLVVCASPKYLKKLKEEIKTPNDLKKHPICTLDVYGECKFTKTGMPIRDLFSGVGRQIVTESGLLQTEFILNGAGVGIRSLWDVQKYFDDGSLVQLLPNQPIESFGTIFAVLTSNRLLAKRVRVFLDFLVNEFNQR